MEEVAPGGSVQNKHIVFIRAHARIFDTMQAMQAHGKVALFVATLFGLGSDCANSCIASLVVATALVDLGPYIQIDQSEKVQ